MASEAGRTTGTPAIAGDGRIGGNGVPPMKPPGYFEGETMTRRRMFTGGAMALGGIAGAAIGLPAIGFAIGPVFEEHEFTWQDVGAPAEFSAENFVPRTVTLTENIGEAGKSTVYIRKSDPELPGER